MKLVFLPLFLTLLAAIPSRSATAAPVITAEPTPVLATPGKPAQFAITATGATSFQWHKDGHPIPGATGGTYVIPAPQQSDEGSYSVIAADGNAKVTSKPARLLLVAPWQNPVALIYDFNVPPDAQTNAVVDTSGRTTAVLVKGPIKAIPGPNPANRGAWDFAGTNAYVSVKSNPVLQSIGDINQTSGLTMTFWVNGTRLEQHRRLVGFGDTIEITSGPKGGTSLNILFGNGSNINTVSLNTPKNTLDGSWHQIVATVDFRATKDNIKLYMDGVLVPAATASGTVQRSFTTKGPLNIGARNNGGYPAQVKIDQFCIFTKALTPDEITQLIQTATIQNFSPTVVAQVNNDQVAAPENTLALLGVASDDHQPPPGRLVAAWSKIKGPGDVKFSNPSGPASYATFTTPGDYILRLSVNDGSVTEKREVAVTFTSNAAPRAVASVNRDKVSVLPAEVLLNGGAFDDGLPTNPGRVSHQWSQVSGPDKAVFAAPSAVRTLVKLPQSKVGTYVFRLTATDGALSGTTDLKVDVVPNLAPVVAVTAQRPIIDFQPGGKNTFTVSARATDDAHPASPGKLSYLWTLVDGPGKVNLNDPTAASPAVTVDAPGIYHLRVTADDGELKTEGDIWLKALPPEISKIVKAPSEVPPFSPQPPPFEHPRLFFTDADRADLRARAQGDPTVVPAIEALRRTVADTLDNPESLMGRAYIELKRGNTDYDYRSLLSGGTGPMLGNSQGGLYGVLSAACYLAWLDPSNPRRLTDLATAVATAARSQSKWYVPDAPRGGRIDNGGLCHDVNADIAFCYDLSYNWMTEDQRISTRDLLALMTTNRRGIGWRAPDHDLATNWRDAAQHVLLAQQVIEGEPGYDAKAAADNTEAIKVFVSRWGINAEGFNREGPGYFGLGMHDGALATYAASRRGENLLVTSNFYQSAVENFYCMSPDTEQMWGHGDAGGWNNGPGRTSLYDVLKGSYPKDELIDFTYRNALKDKGIRNNQPLIRAIFGHEPLPGNDTFAAAAAARGLSLDVYSRQRGFGSARSDWTPGGVRLDFDNRFDTIAIGHLHTDRNSFYLYSHRGVWIGESGYHGTDNDAHSTVLIDNLAQAGSSMKRRWPSLPGKFVEQVSTPDFALFAGDAKMSYTYSWPNPDFSYSNLGKGVPTPFRWVDFIPTGFELAQPFHFDNTWAAQPIHAEPELYNPVQRAFRTTMLVRGPHPYVLVFDDIQKDNKTHSYVWSANTGQGGADLEPQSGASAKEAIFFRTAQSAAGDPRLLVRVLDGKGTPFPVGIDSTSLPDNDSRRLVIRRDNVVAPDFKVLLYPHRDGEPIPETSLNGDQLSVKFPDGTTDEWKLAVQPDGRTRVVSFVRGGGTPPVITVPAMAPAVADETSTYGLPAARVSFAPTAVDSTGKSVAVTTQPPSGSLLLVGVNPVIATAVDGKGRVSMATFNVTVTAPPATPTTQTTPAP